jgi:hypothetical protein
MGHADLIFYQQRPTAIGYMQTALILDIYTGAYFNPINVPADDTLEPDAGVITHRHIPKDDSVLSNQHSLANLGYHALKNLNHRRTFIAFFAFIACTTVAEHSYKQQAAGICK